MEGHHYDRAQPSRQDAGRDMHEIDGHNSDPLDRSGLLNDTIDSNNNILQPSSQLSTNMTYNTTRQQQQQQPQGLTASDKLNSNKQAFDARRDDLHRQSQEAQSRVQQQQQQQQRGRKSSSQGPNTGNPPEIYGTNLLADDADENESGDVQNVTAKMDANKYTYNHHDTVISTASTQYTGQNYDPPRQTIREPSSPSSIDRRNNLNLNTNNNNTTNTATNNASPMRVSASSALPGDAIDIITIEHTIRQSFDALIGKQPLPYLISKFLVVDSTQTGYVSRAQFAHVITQCPELKALYGAELRACMDYFMDRSRGDGTGIDYEAFCRFAK